MTTPEVPARVLWQKRRRGEIPELARAGAVLLQPTGSIEQHGPHLPLDTDIVSATAVAGRAAEQVAEFPVLVLPPVWWGLSPYWMSFPGTLTVRVETLVDLIVDIAASVAHHGFRRLVLVNGHGGNDGLIQAAAVKASTPPLRVAALSYWSLVPDVMREIAEHDAGDIGHAGELETSLQLRLQPERVALGEVRPEHCLDLRRAAPAVRTAGPAYVPPAPERESPHGVYGFAPAGHRDKGERLLAAAAARLADFVRAFREAS